MMPGDSWVGLSSGTSATFVLSEGDKVKEVLLATSPGDSIEEAAEYFIDMITIAVKPELSPSEAFLNIKASCIPIVARMFAGEISQDGQRYILDSISGAFSTTEVGFVE